MSFIVEPYGWQSICLGSLGHSFTVNAFGNGCNQRGQHNTRLTSNGHYAIGSVLTVLNDFRLSGFSCNKCSQRFAAAPRMERVANQHNVHELLNAQHLIANMRGSSENPPQ